MPSRNDADVQLCACSSTCGRVNGRRRRRRRHSSPATFSEAPPATSVDLHRCAAAKTRVFLRYLMGWPTARWWLRHDRAKLPLEATGVAPRAVALTATGVRVVAVVAASVASSTSTNRHRDALDDAIGRALPWSLPRIVSVIGREVSTNHVRLHGGAISSQLFRCVRDIGTVFSIVDSDFAVEAVSVVVGFVVRVGPMTALANAYSSAEASVICRIESTVSSTTCTCSLRQVGRRYLLCKYIR